ncbi:DUF6440 family protein [Lacticaseibacillus parakribbianus]|uniref:DUF6440 family protein n=1 Tax=Lacticaseibacillus parakribbianus TaxID=2970927 RepID=UPI0021CB3368|nr:DUF6440 family protein [Lacticaseibacillus parakribbianus]
MANKESRFVVVAKAPVGWAHVAEVLVDRETRVQYVVMTVGSGGGMTVLVGADGKPLLYDGPLD